MLATATTLNEINCSTFIGKKSLVFFFSYPVSLDIVDHPVAHRNRGEIIARLRFNAEPITMFS